MTLWPMLTTSGLVGAVAACVGPPVGVRERPAWATPSCDSGAAEPARGGGCCPSLSDISLRLAPVDLTCVSAQRASVQALASLRSGRERTTPDGWCVTRHQFGSATRKLPGLS